MDLMTAAGTALRGLFSSSSSSFSSSSPSSFPRHEDPAIATQPSPTSFPQFSNLATELRLKIWSFAATPRVLRIHLHSHRPGWIDEEERFQGYASDTNELFGGPEFGPRYVPQEEPGADVPGYTPSRLGPHHMTITSCTQVHPCRCRGRGYPATSHHALPPPGAYYACRESYGVLAKQYIRAMDDEYDDRGVKVLHGCTELVKSSSNEPPVTGVMINPPVDTVLIKVNVASRGAVRVLHRFAILASQQIPEVRNFVLELQIVMPPYRFWGSQRLEYWKKWGATGWWVPVRHVVKMKSLKEVTLVGKNGGSMLPDDWKIRTERQWAEELEKVREQWPDEWYGVAPTLRCNLSADKASAW